MRDVNALHWLNLAHSLLEGDGTFEWNGDPFTPTRGYQVGGITTYKNPETPELLARWLHAASQEHEKYNTQVGSWRDPSDGTLYIDVTDWWTSHYAAMIEAEIQGEKAIWDWERSEAIEVVTPA